MNKANRALIRKNILNVAPEMQKRLPAHESHPKGRIAVAHCYHVIKSIFGVKVEDIRDERLNEVLEVVKFCYDHAEEKHICSQLYAKYSPEPIYEPTSLEEFFNE